MRGQIQCSMARRTLTVETKKRREIINLDRLIQEFVKENQVREGILFTRTLHTTSAIIINEFEPGLMTDIESFLNKVVPEIGYYHHDDPRIHPLSDKDERKNGFAHLQAILLGPGGSVSVSGGQLVLGPWQSVLFVELDGPRAKRQIELTAWGT